MKEQNVEVHPAGSIVPLKHALMGASGQLGYIVSHAKQIAQYNAWLQDWFVSPLKGNCEVANFSESALVLMVSKPALATRVICLQQDILQFFKSQHQVSFLSVKVIMSR